MVDFELIDIAENKLLQLGNCFERWEFLGWYFPLKVVTPEDVPDFIDHASPRPADVFAQCSQPPRLLVGS